MITFSYTEKPRPESGNLLMGGEIGKFNFCIYFFLPCCSADSVQNLCGLFYGL